MEALMRREAKTVVDDHKNDTGLYDGIIYIMHTRAVDGIIVRSDSVSLRAVVFPDSAIVCTNFTSKTSHFLLQRTQTYRANLCGESKSCAQLSGGGEGLMCLRRVVARIVVKYTPGRETGW
jgi:hypothetical protein